jgi:hypothetical protein
VVSIVYVHFSTILFQGTQYPLDLRLANESVFRLNRLKLMMMLTTGFSLTRGFAMGSLGVVQMVQEIIFSRVPVKTSKKGPYRLLPPAGYSATSMLRYR